MTPSANASAASSHSNSDSSINGCDAIICNSSSNSKRTGGHPQNSSAGNRIVDILDSSSISKGSENPRHEDDSVGPIRTSAAPQEAAKEVADPGRKEGTDGEGGENGVGEEEERVGSKRA